MKIQKEFLVNAFCVSFQRDEMSLQWCRLLIRNCGNGMVDDKHYYSISMGFIHGICTLVDKTNGYKKMEELTNASSLYSALFVEIHRRR